MDSRDIEMSLEKPQPRGSPRASPKCQPISDDAAFNAVTAKPLVSGAQPDRWLVRTYAPESEIPYESLVFPASVLPRSTAQNVRNYILSTYYSFAFMLLFFAFFIISFGALGLHYMCGSWCEARRGYGDMLWLSWSLFISISTQGRVLSSESPGMLFLSMLISTLGFIWTLVVFGMVVQLVRVAGSRIATDCDCLIHYNHYVVVGWSRKTIFLLGQLADKLAETEKGSGTIVVMGELEEHRMRHALHIAYPRWRARWPKVRIDFWHASPIDLNALMRVSIQSACTVFVMGSDEQDPSPMLGDIKLISRLFTINSLPKAHALTSATTIVAELSLRQNTLAVTRIGGISPRVPEHLRVLPVEVHAIASDALALFALEPLVGLIATDLIDLDGDQLQTISARAYAPTTFDELQRRLAAMVVVGFLRKRGGSQGLVLAPTASTRIAADDELIVIAKDKASLAEAEGAPVVTPRGRRRLNPLKPPPAGAKPKPTPTTRLLKRSSSLAGKTSAMVHHVNASLFHGHDNAFDGRHSPFSRHEVPPRCVVILGWHRSLGSLLRALDARLASRSEVFLLSLLEVKRRAEALLFDGIVLDERGASPLLPNLAAVHHVVGTPLCYATLAQLPIHQASCALILGDDAGSKPDDQTDSEVVAITLLLQQVRVEACRVAHASGTPPPPPLTVVAQFLSVNSGRVLKSHPGALRIDPAALQQAAGGVPVHDDVEVIAFQRNRIATAALTAAAHRASTWEAFVSLLRPHLMGQISVLRAAQVFGMSPRSARDAMLGVRASFHDLRTQLLETGQGVLIGWRRGFHRASADGEPAEHELNPPDKAVQLMWEADDELIVLQQSADVSSP